MIRISDQILELKKAFKRHPELPLNCRKIYISLLKLKFSTALTSKQIKASILGRGVNLSEQEGLTL